MRRSVQSYIGINFFLLDKSPFYGAAKSTFLGFSIRDKKAARTRCELKKLYWLSILVAAAAAVLPFAVITEAQQPGKIFRIGFLDLIDARSSAVRMQPFWQELRRLGWSEGKNIHIEYRFAEDNTRTASHRPHRTDGPHRTDLAAELVRMKVDVIVCASTGAALAAKKASTTIPIVMASSADPVGAGLVASLAQPGGNVTGVSILQVELNTKRLEVLKDTVPKLARVGIPRGLLSATSVSDELQMKEVRGAAVVLKLKLEEITTKLDSKGLESAFQSLKQKQADAILPFSRPLFAVRKRIVALASEYRLPAIYPHEGICG
jgi:putative ABC transport system substrate-binding protein